MSAQDLDRLEAELMRALEAARTSWELAPKGEGRYWAAMALEHIKDAIKAAGTRETLA